MPASDIIAKITGYRVMKERTYKVEFWAALAEAHNVMTAAGKRIKELESQLEAQKRL